MPNYLAKYLPNYVRRGTVLFRWPDHTHGRLEVYVGRGQWEPHDDPSDWVEGVPLTRAEGEQAIEALDIQAS